MGCLNSKGQFEHWFANIHFSGLCNRACYFCIGQHMEGLDPINNLNMWPLEGLGEFIHKCIEKQVKEVNLTGTDTDPMLYVHLDKLCSYLRKQIPNVEIGVRTNGALSLKRKEQWKLFDKGSISVTSLEPVLYKATMGKGQPPPLQDILQIDAKVNKNLKINIVLCPEILSGGLDCDLLKSLSILKELGFKRVNLREPYGQPHIGCPLDSLGYLPSGKRLGMPKYDIFGLDVTYWDVHYVEVESINLYANGNISETYPVTKGYDPVFGNVKGQEHFEKPGRQIEQWVEKPKVKLPLYGE